MKVAIGREKSRDRQSAVFIPSIEPEKQTSCDTASMPRPVTKFKVRPKTLFETQRQHSKTGIPTIWLL